MMENIVRGPERKEYIPYECLGKIFYKALKSRCPNDICLVDLTTGENVPTSKLLEDSMKVYHFINGLKLDTNSPVVVFAQNTWRTVVPFLASVFACRPVHLINPEAVIGELNHFLTISKPSTIFCYTNQLSKVTKLQQELGFIESIVLLDNPQVEIICELEQRNVVRLQTILNSKVDYGEFEPKTVGMKETILIMNSSGTTGVPKCVMLTHENIHFYINSWLDERVFRFDKSDNLILFLPIYHLYGLYVLWISFFLGTKCLIMNKFNGKLFIKSVAEYNVSKLFMVPPIVQYLAKVHLSSSDEDILKSKTIISGASILSREVMDLIRERYNITIKQIYGMTECGIIVANRWNVPEDESCGQIIPGTSMKIVDIATKEKLPPNHSGEICTKGPCVMRGYMNDEEHTRRAIDPEGFIHTGDLGYYDENGFIFVTDRLKDIIKFKAYQVSPSQIEGILLRHPSVKDAAVTSIPDEYAGELPLALIVKQIETKVTEEDIIKYVQANMSYQSQLHGGVKFVEEIPKSRSGKILRRELSKLL